MLFTQGIKKLSENYWQQIGLPKNVIVIGMNKLLDATLSIKVGQSLKKLTKNAFENAYKAALLHPQSNYVQGFLVVAGESIPPIEHSWIELDDNVVDPSFTLWDKKAEELYYFPAQRLTVKQLISAVEEAKEDYPEDNPLPVYGGMPYEYYGEVMLGGKDYQAAYEAALAFSQEINVG